jgi:hypothetical protein
VIATGSGGATFNAFMTGGSITIPNVETVTIENYNTDGTLSIGDVTLSYSGSYSITYSGNIKSTGGDLIATSAILTNIYTNLSSPVLVMTANTSTTGSGGGTFIYSVDSADAILALTVKTGTCYPTGLVLPTS